MSRRSFAAIFGCVAAAAHFAAAEEALGVGGAWTTVAPLPEKRGEVSVTTDGDRIYLLGGFGLNSEGQASAPLAVYGYDPGEDGWMHITDLPEEVNHAGLAHVGGSLYVVGGFRGSSFEALDDLHIYDLERTSWRDAPPLPTARGALAVVVYGGRLHAIGGTDAAGENTGAHEIFDPASETWTAAAALPMPRNHLGAASVDGEIVVLGGRDETSATLTSPHIYDTASGAKARRFRPDAAASLPSSLTATCTSSAARPSIRTPPSTMRSAITPQATAGKHCRQCRRPGTGWAQRC